MSNDALEKAREKFGQYVKACDEYAIRTEAAEAALKSEMRIVLDAAEARCARLEEALERIIDLKAGGPHISAEDGFSAALCSLDRARDIALAALQQETGQIDAETPALEDDHG